jgi:hypothetical protein
MDAAEACASIGKNGHQMRLRHILHSTSEVQVRDRAALDPPRGLADGTTPSRAVPAVPAPLRIGLEALRSAADCPHRRTGGRLITDMTAGWDTTNHHSFAPPTARNSSRT